MSSNHHKIHLHKKPTTTINLRRRRLKVTTVNHHHHPTVVSPKNSSWCCPSAVSSNKHKSSSDSPALCPLPESFSGQSPVRIKKIQTLNSDLNLDKKKMSTNHQETFPSSFTNFNYALTTGLLNLMSPRRPSEIKPDPVRPF